MKLTGRIIQCKKNILEKFILPFEENKEKLSVHHLILNAAYESFSLLWNKRKIWADLFQEPLLNFSKVNNCRGYLHLFLYKQPVCKQLALAWQIIKRRLGLNTFTKQQ